MVRAVTDGFRQCLDIDSTSRSLIKSNNLTHSTPLNKPVRQALGFREIDDLYRPKVKFISLFVTRVYKELEFLMKEKLPVHSMKEMLQAWDEGTFSHDVEVLVSRYGPKIWSDAMDQRQPEDNPQSQLLVKEEYEFCKTDLFWHFSHHRDFIMLQVEHLLFVRGIVFHRNHHTYPAAKGPKTQNTLHSINGVAAKPTLVVVLRLPKELLRGVKRKRRSTAHDISREKDYSYRPRWEKDVVPSPDPYKLRSSGGRGGSSASMRVDELISDNADDLETSRNPVTRTSNINDAVNTRTASKRSRDQRSSLGRENSAHTHPISRASQDLRNPDGRDNAANTRPTPIASRNPRKSLGLDNARTVSVPRGRPMDESPHNLDSAGNHVISEQELVLMRFKFQIQLFEEFGNIEETHSRSGNQSELWTKSQELDKTFKKIWEADRVKLQDDVGLETYEKMDKTVQDWLKWRRVAKNLGELAGLHLSEDKSLPHHTFEEWVKMLGGLNQFMQVKYQLTEYNVELQLGASTDEASEKITKAFAQAAKYPQAAHLFKQGVAAFHGQLLSWSRDFDN